MPGKIGKALGFPGLDETSVSDAPVIDEEPASAKPSDNAAEVMAMKMFSNASSPEAKVEAMKAFLEACGVY